ncbi:MAG: hypothetical protein CVU97_07140 [Firmicutes bacterium HGW-Firmicutes-21]|nr:MAG: hypothetical protein CVU97_07140 [Firmicutes bacterium HGW-Firmicutes-21]
MIKINLIIKNFLLDLIPAFGGLIGKVALVSSFALVWAKELDISTPNFVFENVRLEIFIGSIVTLIAALIFHNIAPAGTLAPLIVLIPAMANFGVHPLILSILVGILGIISVKTKVFERLISISGDICKTSLTLVFGVSGVILATQKLINFFGNRYIPLLLLLLTLATTYTMLFVYKKTWLIIPIAAGVSLAFSWLFGLEIDTSSHINAIQFDPIYWWEDMWGIGFGLNIITILKTLPFALFVVLLWTVDTVSIQAVISTGFKENENNEKININQSFMVISLRNLISGFFGGAQTSSLWRSFLIPLYMMKRPLCNASIMLGILGIIAGITAAPIRILSFPPLVWSVLLFGIFIPFINSGIKYFKDTNNFTKKSIIVLLAVFGIVFSPILTWFGAVLYEKINKKGV